MSCSAVISLMVFPRGFCADFVCEQALSHLEAHSLIIISEAFMPLKNRDAVVGEALTGAQEELWQLLGNWKQLSCNQQDCTRAGGHM